MALVLDDCTRTPISDRAYRLTMRVDEEGSVDERAWPTYGLRMATNMRRVAHVLLLGGTVACFCALASTADPVGNGSSRAGAGPAVVSASDEAQFTAALSQHGPQLYAVKPSPTRAASVETTIERVTLGSEAITTLNSPRMPNALHKVATMDERMPHVTMHVGSPESQELASLQMPINVMQKVPALDVVETSGAPSPPGVQSVLDRLPR